jgi:glycosyltransferase involved in cell wall biosynthesis
MSADLSIVICSLNGAPGVNRCLKALAEQKTSARLEIIVVDDGSSDNTTEVALKHGARVIRHPVNRGIAAARNTGLSAASAPIIAYLDDDCEPTAQWAEALLAGYRPQIAGVGGPILPQASSGLIMSYLNRHNPLQPQELNLATSDRLLYRLRLYLQRQWRPSLLVGERDVYSLVGANMSFRREVLLAAGGFDERFRFGAEEVDLCIRLLRTEPPARLAFVPDATIRHHFRPSLHDVLRRSRAYGRGSARLYRKWPGLPPTIFPGPVIVAALLAPSARVPVLAAVALALPLLLYPQGLRGAISRRGLSCLLDGYVQLGQETCEDLGFAEGLWRFRGLVPESASTLQDATAVGGRQAPSP